MRVRQRAGVFPGGDQAGDVRHVDPEPGPHLVGNRPHPRPVLDAGIGREAADEQLGFVLQRQALHLVVIDQAGFRVESVGHDLILLAREIGRMAVRQVTALGEVHAHHHVTGADQAEKDGGIGLGAGMRLHVGVVAVENLLDAIDGQQLGNIDMLAAAVIALAGIPLGVLVGQR